MWFLPHRRIHRVVMQLHKASWNTRVSQTCPGKRLEHVLLPIVIPPLYPPFARALKAVSFQSSHGGGRPEHVGTRKQSTEPSSGLKGVSIHSQHFAVAL